MAITFVNTSSETFPASTTEDETLPASLAENDYVICAFVLDPPAVPTINSSGWTSIFSSAGGSPSILVVGKRMGATPDTVINITTGVNIHGVFMSQAFRGVDTTTAQDAAATTATGGTGMPNPASITTVTNGAMVVIVGGLDDDNATDVVAATGYQDNDAFLAEGSAANDTATVMFASAIKATAGAEDPGVWTASTGNDAWQAVTIALRPQADAGGTTWVGWSGAVGWF